jgi:hypothetical protein
MLCWEEEDNSFVLAVTGGGEMDDREVSMIEDEMDKLRMGGCSIAGSRRQ